ncbi:hypothetical protein VM98_36790, partial [Streptomyces rubellomurinus subsp. indigoferus]
PNLDGERAARYIARLGAAGVVADEAHLTALAGHAPGGALLPGLGALVAGGPAAAPEPHRPCSGHPVALTHSSAATGIPKPVVHPPASPHPALRHRLRPPRPPAHAGMRSP